MDLTTLTPITFLGICRGVALDNTYQNTYTFANETDQHNFFRNKVVYPFTDLTPISVNNQIRIPLNQEKLYNCNYVIWQNKNFGTKYFYGFITDIQFVNINMSIITVQLDVMQTWYFDYTMRKCFVVREHTNDDTIGNNLIEENLALGDYITYQQKIPENSLLTDMSIVIACTVNLLGDGVTGAMYGNVYSGVTFNSFSTAADANNFIATILNKNPDNINAIVSIFMLPTYFAKVIGTDDQKNLTPFTWSLPKYGVTGAFEGYQPKNNKLYTYPYNFMIMSTGDSNYAEYHFEYFNSVNCQFNIYSTMTPNPIMFEIPIAYLVTNTEMNYDEKLSISGFPQCSYNIDSYKAYLSQIGVDGVINRAGNIINAAVGAIGNVASSMGGSAFQTIKQGENMPKWYGKTKGANVYNQQTDTTYRYVDTGYDYNIASALTGTISWLAEIQKAKNMPPQIAGNSTADIGAALQRKIFCANYKSIRSEYAKIIDDYFTYYGYMTKQFKIPNITGRKSWNYVKTEGCNITGNIPFNDIANIKAIYNNGITFWHGDYIGNYTLDNSIL